MTRYLALAEYFWLAERVTGIQAAVLVKASQVELADSALHAPAAGFCDLDFYPDLLEIVGYARMSSIEFWRSSTVVELVSGCSNRERPMQRSGADTLLTL